MLRTRTGRTQAVHWYVLGELFLLLSSVLSFFWAHVVKEKATEEDDSMAPKHSTVIDVLNELRTSQISFALVYMSYEDVRKALDQFSEEPAAKHKRHALQLAYTLAQSAHTLAQKAYAESYERVQEAEQAVVKRKAELSAQRQ